MEMVQATGSECLLSDLRVTDQVVFFLMAKTIKIILKLSMLFMVMCVLSEVLPVIVVPVTRFYFESG